MREMKTIKHQTGNPLGISLCADIPGGAAGSRPASTVERWMLKEMLRGLGNPSVAVVPWHGKAVTNVGREQARIKVHLRDSGALFRLVLDPEFQFGELYSRGHIEVEGDLVALIPLWRGQAQSAHRCRPAGGRCGWPGLSAQRRGHSAGGGIGLAGGTDDH